MEDIQLVDENTSGKEIINVFNSQIEELGIDLEFEPYL